MRTMQLSWVLASEGYPVKYDKGLPIRGLENFKGKEGYYVFHAGTKFDESTIVTTAVVLCDGKERKPESCQS